MEWRMHLELEFMEKGLEAMGTHTRTGTLASGVPLQLAAGLGRWLGPKCPGVGCAGDQMTAPPGRMMNFPGSPTTQTSSQ